MHRRRSQGSNYNKSQESGEGGYYDWEGTHWKLLESNAVLLLDL